MWAISSPVCDFPFNSSEMVRRQFLERLYCCSIFVANRITKPARAYQRRITSVGKLVWSDSGAHGLLCNLRSLRHFASAAHLGDTTFFSFPPWDSKISTVTVPWLPYPSQFLDFAIPLYHSFFFFTTQSFGWSDVQVQPRSLSTTIEEKRERESGFRG